MRSILFAAALAAASLPAQAAITYQFSGTCTESYIDTGEPDGHVAKPCEPFILGIVREIELSDDYVPGAVFHYNGLFDDWLPLNWWMSGQLPETSGPGAIIFDFFVGRFEANPDGSWLLRFEHSEYPWGNAPFYAFGTSATFTRVGASAVPLPGTLALLGVGALIAAARRR